MAKEEFTVRVTRTGEIFVEFEGLPPRRVQDLMKYLEETLGPARLVANTGEPTAPGSVELEAEEQEQAEEKPRLRLEGR